jgi:hypothetical protein
LVACLWFVTTLAAAQDPSERWREVTGGTRGEPRGMAAADFDDDGRPDVAMALAGPALIVRIEGTTGPGWLTKQTIVSPSENYDVELPVGWAKPGPDGLVMLLESGAAVEYAGWPLAEARRFDIASGATAGVIGDIDADGADELVVATFGGVFAYDLASGEEEWSQPGTSDDVQIAQLDADAALEVIVAGAIGRVLDGATQAEDWSYPDGFGAYLATGRFFQDGSTGFVGVKDWDTATVFRATPWSPMWDYPEFDLDAVDACDVDGDGRDELVIGDGQWGAVHVVDTDTHADQQTIDHDDHGTSDVSARDFEGNGGCQIVFASRSAYSGRLFHVFDAATGAVRHAGTVIEGGVAASVIADLDGNGQPELVTATRGDEPARLRVADAVTGALIWELAPASFNANDPFYMDVERVLVAQADADPELEIVMIGTAPAAGRVTIVDSATRTVQRQIGTYAAGPMRNRTAVDAALLDYDLDGRDDVVVATQASNTGSSGSRLQVFGLDDGALLWESIAMGSGFSGIVAVLVLQSDADPAPELVAVLPNGLRAFDAATQLLEWTATLPDGIVSAAYDPMAGQFALGRDGTLTVHDAATRDIVRTIPTTGIPAAVAALPGSQRWIAYDESALAVFGTADGERLGSSEWLGPALAGAQMVAVPAGTDWLISSASQIGHFVHGVGPAPDIFADGFEP